MKQTRLIEEYLDGTIGVEEKKDFIARMNGDASLKDLLIMHAEVNESIRDEDLHALRKQLSRIGGAYLSQLDDADEDIRRKKRNGWKERVLNSVYFRAVSALLLLLAAGVILKTLFFNELPAEILYDKYYLPYEADVVMRSTETENTGFEEAVMNYQKGQYEAASDALADLPEGVSDQNLVSFYKGLTCLGLMQYEEAVSFLSRIPEEWLNPHSVHRDWYLALAYLKVGELIKATEILNDIKLSGSYYADRASEILRRIRT